MLVILFAALCLTSVRSRDIGREIRSKAGVSSSLINLGRMDFNFYFNSNPKDLEKKLNQESSMKQCPCVRSANVHRDSSALKNPFDILERIMNPHDIFSLEEPSFSPECCISGGIIHEDILLELPSKPSKRPTNTISKNFFPFPSEFFMNLPKSKPPVKDNAIEIFLFPKRKDIVGNNKMIAKSTKNDITAVGAKVHDAHKKIELPPVPIITNDINDPNDKKMEAEKKEDIKKQEEPKTAKILI